MKCKYWLWVGDNVIYGSFSRDVINGSLIFKKSPKNIFWGVCAHAVLVYVGERKGEGLGKRGILGESMWKYV